MPSAAERLANVDAVLFDLDGTLIDTVELIRVSFRHATRVVLGASLPDEVTMAGVGMPLIRQMRDFSPENADELLRVYREFNAERHDGMVREYPGTAEVLSELRRRGLPLGIVTSKGTPMTLRGLRRFGLERYFDAVVTADDVPLHKPDPFPVRRAADLLAVAPERCAYVGDSPHDMQAALAAGAVAVAALWGAFPREQVLAPGPDAAIETLTELLPLIFGTSAHPIR
jgi:pyrophosphatase PpaX